jgi:hypothetical protein
MTDLRTLFACLIVTSAPCVALAGADVQTYTRSSNISRSEGLFTTRQYVPAADFREGRLRGPIPYPVNRTDDPRRVENGRLWVSRSPVGSRSIIEELPYGFPGAAGYGAPFGANEEVIFVRSETGLPEIAISPFDTIDDSTFETIERQIPFIGSTRTKTSLVKDEILSELREAQNQWLREQGYIQKVRTHVNPMVIHGTPDVAEARDASTIEPRAIIRKREMGDVSADAGGELETVAQGRTVRISSETDVNETSVIRVSGTVQTAEAED